MKKITIYIISFVAFLLYANAGAFALTANLPEGYFMNKVVTNIDPQVLAFSPDGTLYVKHFYDNEVYITRFTDRAYETIFVDKGLNGDQGQMTFDKQGNLYSVSSLRNAVYKIEIPKLRLETYDFDNCPTGVAYKDGFLYVITSLDGIVWKLNPEKGTKVVFADTKILGRGTGLFSRLQFDPFGNLLATSSSDPYYEIIKIDSSGQISSYLNDPNIYLFNPRDMAFNSNGELFVNSIGWHNWTDGRIWFIDSNLQPKIFAGFINDSNSKAGGTSLAIDNADNLFVGFGVRSDSDLSINKISKNSSEVEPLVFQQPTNPKIVIGNSKIK